MPPHSNAKNFDAERWTDQERKIVQDANSREETIARYREKFPASIRSDDAIGRQFYELHPDKRHPKLTWADEEKDPILTADRVEEAIANYQKLFPESKRSIPAIKREWYELHPEKRGLISRGRKKGGTNKAPLKGTAREKYQIPFSTTQDAKAYNHAVYICTKYDKPYAEALAREERDRVERKLKAENKAVKVRKIRGRPPKKIMVVKPPREPKTPVSAPVKFPTPDPVTKSESGFSVKQSVVHNGSRSSPHFGKVGKIVQVVKTGTSEHLVILFGPQNAILISPKFVTPVLAAAEVRA